MDSKSLLLIPRMSEKAYGLSQQRNVYVFDIPRNANQTMVAQAVAAQFDVTVVGVNVTTIKGKAKRTVVRGGRRSKSGRQSDTKKAYVKLKPGDTLPFFAAVAEEEAKEKETQVKAAKALEKSQAADAKTDEKKTRRLGRRTKKEEA